MTFTCLQTLEISTNSLGHLDLGEDLTFQMSLILACCKDSKVMDVVERLSFGATS